MGRVTFLKRYYRGGKQPTRPMRSSDPSSQSRGSFHVFLSFMGHDVRNTFLGHLHNGLIREGIRVYIDSEDLQRGDEITQSLKKAIQDSRIAIVVFSENYASSRWCLDELTGIMEHQKQGKLVVKPVYLRVEPREVRTPRYSFAEALATHEFTLGKDSDMVRKWREALFEAGNLSGWTLDANGNEAELVRNIVRDVNALLDRTHLDVAKYPVGIEPRAREIENVLNNELDKVLLIGLWGMAGIGKTTLAKTIFNSFADQFDGCAFLPNVREESANASVGLAKLQEKLLSEVLRRNVMVESIAGGITLIKDRLCRKKVFLLLDDISNKDQLDVLAGGLDWFGNGSRILVTTRDRSILRTHCEHIVHKVEGLPYNQALQLFSKHAFPEYDRANIAKDLIDRCLAYCDGLPLALVVLGSLLRNREERHWKSILKLLKQGRCEEIDKVFRVGFHELDHNLREIFLHIACFFKGGSRREIEKALDACGFETSLGIEMLMDRSLITIVEDTSCGSSVERVEMHPLLQLMCDHIVCQGSPDEHWNRSRQLDYEEGTHSVLSNGKGTNTLKGLALRTPHPKEMRFRGDTSTNVKKSRRLIMGNWHYVEDPMCFPGDLPWIKCSGYSISNTLFSRPRKFKVQNSGCRAQSFDAACPLVAAPDPSPFSFLHQLSSSRSPVRSHRLRVRRPRGQHPHLCYSRFFMSSGNGVLCHWL